MPAQSIVPRCAEDPDAVATSKAVSTQNKLKRTRRSKGDAVDEIVSITLSTVENETRKRRRDSRNDDSSAAAESEITDNQEAASGRYSTRGTGVKKSSAAVSSKPSKSTTVVVPEKQSHTKSSSRHLPRNLSESSTKPNAPSEPILDAVYYFGIYLKYYHDNIYKLAKDKRVILTITDDACFLCKDGGNLVECDCLSASNKKCRCLKTYHQECLGYVLEDDVQFKCARYFL